MTVDDDPQVQSWIAAGSPLGPVDWQVKSWILVETARRHGYTTLIETGSYDGKNLLMVAPYFEVVHSIELSEAYFELCRKKLALYGHVCLHHGDSAVVLPEILKTLSEPAVVWLDAHAMGGDTAKGALVTPIEAELEALAGSDLPHAIVIDDVEEFRINDEYPSEGWLVSTAKLLFPTWRLTYIGNELCILPCVEAAIDAPLLWP